MASKLKDLHSMFKFSLSFREVFATCAAKARRRWALDRRCRGRKTGGEPRRSKTAHRGVARVAGPSQPQCHCRPNININ